MRVMICTISVAALFATSHSAKAGWLDSLFGPQDYEDCVLDGLKGAASTERVIGAVRQACHSKFPARRAPDGYGYVYTVPGGYGDCRVNGPVPTPKELADIEVWKKKPLPDVDDWIKPTPGLDYSGLKPVPPPGFKLDPKPANPFAQFAPQPAPAPPPGAKPPWEKRWAGYVDGNSEARCH